MRNITNEKLLAAMEGETYMDGDKEYLVIDHSKSVLYDNFNDFLLDVFTPEEIAESKALVAAQTIGDELVSMRIRAGFSQKMMAAALGVSQPRISAIESAPNSRANWSVVQKYVQVTGCSFKAVLEDGTTVSFKAPRRQKPRSRKQRTAPAVPA